MEAKETKDVAIAFDKIVDAIVKAKQDDGVISITDVKYIPETVPAIIEAISGSGNIPKEVEAMFKTMNFTDLQEIFGIMLPAVLKLINAFKVVN